jgi:small-conductance mechanosensitive channel
MKTYIFSSLISDVLDDLNQPGVAWQFAAIIISIAGGWLLARGLQKLFADTVSVPEGLRLKTDSFGRVLAAALSLGLLAIAKLVLIKWSSVNLLRVTIPLFGALLLIRFVFYLLHPVIATRSGKTGRALLHLEQIFSVLVWIWFVLYITDVWPDLLQILNDTNFIVGTKTVSVLSILQASASVIVTLMLALWGAALLETRLMRLEDMHMSLRVAVSRTTRALLMLIAVLLSLSMVGIDLTVLSVFGGALGVGLGFGLQKIASNYVSGFIILLDRSLSIDDVITVDKFHGTVTEISTRYTVLRGLDGVESIIPNEMLISSTVQNHSLTDRDVRISTDVTVGYETDIDALLAILEKTVAEVPRVSSGRPPSATLVKFGADGLELRIGFWISDPEKGTSVVLSDANRAIWKVLQEHRIDVPYPQRVIRMIGEPV